MINNITRLPVLAMFFLLSYYGLKGHFIMLLGKCSSIKKFKMELKCPRYDVTVVFVYNVFYHTK
jgi:hypothetical protein